MPIPPKPTSAEVYGKIHQFNATQKYIDLAQLLDHTFRAKPSNTRLMDVLEKVMLLNSAYSTNIFDVYEAAGHIVKANIDPLLAIGDLRAVELIRKMTLGGKLRDNYVFATKYCAIHQPSYYRFYDQFVGKTLKYFRRTDKFMKFYNDDLKNYSKFCKIVAEFEMYYGISGFTPRDLDKYLWLTGKRI